MVIKNTIGLIIIILVTLAAFSANAQGQKDIKYEDFQLQQTGARLYILWATGKSVATNYFEIEKSIDGENFQTLAYVLGPDPRGDGNHYAFFEKISNLSGDIYYRVKHISPDNRFQYSSVRKVSYKNI